MCKISKGDSKPPLYPEIGFGWSWTLKSSVCVVETLKVSEDFGKDKYREQLLAWKGLLQANVWLYGPCGTVDHVT